MFGSTPAQRVPFSVGDRNFDTASPDDVWTYFNTLERQRDFDELRDAVEVVDEALAGDLDDAWEEYLDSLDYVDEYEDYGSTNNRKTERAAATASVGEFKRGGSKSQRDKWYGGFANNSPAQTWWHSAKHKLNGGHDLTSDIASDMFAKYQEFADSRKK